MKKLLLTFLIIISFKSFAQDPELDDNTWYLQNVIINGEDNIPPVNAEITEVTLDFLVPPYDFTAGMCNLLTGDLSFENSNSTFILSDIYQTLGSCNIPENNIYEVLYFSFYRDNSSQSFTYAITTESDSSTLIVTAANGDQAIYGSDRLHVNEFKITEIKAYPNPVVDELFIERQNSDNLNVRVYNIKGQFMFSETLDQEQSVIGVSELETGVYFFVIEGDNYKKEIKKIIKQ